LKTRKGLDWSMRMCKVFRYKVSVISDEPDKYLS
jgi:hypothetical protein